MTDSTGLTATQSVIIYPRKVNLSFDTVPSGLTLYLDGIAKTTPFVYDTLDRLQPHDRGAQPDRRAGRRTHSPPGRTGARRRTRSSCRARTRATSRRSRPRPARRRSPPTPSTRARARASADASGNGNGGTITNARPGRRQGKYGSALQLQRDERATSTVADAASLRPDERR